jgi:hypothetical protein
LNKRIWLTRFLIALVTTWNLQAALAFILRPYFYAPNFELTGEPGAVVVRGTGILFLMWNVPYLVALWHPRRYSIALGLALVMQVIGLVGESLILVTLPQGHALLRTSITRFITFDASGLVLLAVAFWLLNRNGKPKQV